MIKSAAGPFRTAGAMVKKQTLELKQSRRQPSFLPRPTKNLAHSDVLQLLQLGHFGAVRSRERHLPEKHHGSHLGDLAHQPGKPPSILLNT